MFVPAADTTVPSGIGGGGGGGGTGTVTSVDNVLPDAGGNVALDALVATNNLSDVANAATSLSNLGGVGTTDDRLAPAPTLADAGKVPTVNGAGTAYVLTTPAAGTVTSVDGVGPVAGNVPLGALIAANNLSDVASAATALSNLGGLAKSANLSDLANAATARTNLGLGTAAVANTGTAAGQVPVLNPSALIAAALLGSGTPSSSTVLLGNNTWGPAPAAALTVQSGVYSGGIINLTTSQQTIYSATFAVGTWLIAAVTSPYFATGTAATIVQMTSAVASGTATIGGVNYAVWQPTGTGIQVGGAQGLLLLLPLLTVTATAVVNFQAKVGASGGTQASIAQNSAGNGGCGYVAIKVA